MSDLEEIISDPRFQNLSGEGKRQARDRYFSLVFSKDKGFTSLSDEGKATATQRLDKVFGVDTSSITLPTIPKRSFSELLKEVPTGAEARFGKPESKSRGIEEPLIDIPPAPLEVQKEYGKVPSAIYGGVRAAAQMTTPENLGLMLGAGLLPEGIVAKLAIGTFGALMGYNAAKTFLKGEFSKALKEGDTARASEVAVTQLLSIAGAKAGLKGAFKELPPELPVLPAERQLTYQPEFGKEGEVSLPVVGEGFTARPVKPSDIKPSVNVPVIEGELPLEEGMFAPSNITPEGLAKAKEIVKTPIEPVVQEPVVETTKVGDQFLIPNVPERTMPPTSLSPEVSQVESRNLLEDFKPVTQEPELPISEEMAAPKNKYYKSKQPKTFTQFVRSIGVNPDKSDSSEILELGDKTLINRKRGKSLDAIAEAAIEADRLPSGSTGNDVMDYLSDEAGGKKHYSMQDIHELTPEKIPIEAMSDKEVNNQIEEILSNRGNIKKSDQFKLSDLITEKHRREDLNSRMESQLTDFPFGENLPEGRFPPNAGAVLNPVAIGDALLKIAKESKTYQEFRQKVADNPDFADTIRVYNLNLRNIFQEKEKQSEIPLPTIEKEPAVSGKFSEGQKVRFKGGQTFEVDLSNTSDKLEKALEQIENVKETGTYQPKEIRPELAKGQSAEVNTYVNKETVKKTNAFFFESGKELKRLREQAETNFDDFTVNQLQLAEKRFEIAFQRRKEIARTAHESLYEFNKSVDEVKGILNSLKLIKDVKPKIAALDRLILGGLRTVSLPITERFARSIGEKEIPEDLRLGKAAMDYFRTNLFSIGSWTLDFFTNATAALVKMPSYMAQDIYSMIKGDSPKRTLGIYDSIKLQGKAGLRAIKERTMNEIYRLPNEVENALGRTIGGENIGDMTNIKIGKFPLDYIVSLPIKMKRGMDILFSRSMALADLVSNAIKEADTKGLKGELRERFIDDFVKSPSEEAKNSSIKLGREIKFNVLLSEIENKISGSVGFQLLGETFPRWTFQFGRWVGRTLGANPELLKKVKNKQATPDKVMDYLFTTATGWGGIYLINNTIYPHVDFNSMEYVNEKKERIRLSGRSPIPEALFLNSMMRGDWEKAKKALPYTSFPFGGLIGGQPSGLLGNWVNAMRESMEGRYTSERFRKEVDQMVNKAIPGQAVLSTLKTLIDPTLRKGIGAELPIISTIKEPVISPATGESMQPKQRFGNIELPTIGGIVVPGAKRVLNDVEQELLFHGIGLFRPRRTPIAEFESENVPEDLRDEYERLAGKNVNRNITMLINSEHYQKLPFDKQTDVLKEWKSKAEKEALNKIAQERGKKVKEKKETLRERLLPEFIHR